MSIHLTIVGKEGDIANPVERQGGGEKDGIGGAKSAEVQRQLGHGGEIEAGHKGDAMVHVEHRETDRLDGGF